MGGDMTDAGSVNAFSGFGVFVVARRRHVTSRPSEMDVRRLAIIDMSTLHVRCHGEGG